MTEKVVMTKYLLEKNKEYRMFQNSQKVNTAQKMSSTDEWRNVTLVHLQNRSIIQP